jgi:hypothetical protein
VVGQAPLPSEHIDSDHHTGDDGDKQNIMRNGCEKTPEHSALEDKRDQRSSNTDVVTRGPSETGGDRAEEVSGVAAPCV